MSLSQQISAGAGGWQSRTIPLALETAINPVLPLESAFDHWGHPCAVIVTAIAVECHAVCQHLTDLRQVQHKQGTIYECGQFKPPTGQIWNVAVAEIGEGNSATDRETERAINSFNPRVVLFVGVAGGIKDVQIGDIVAATKVYDYESGKEEEVFKPRPNVRLATYDLEQLAKATRRDWDRRRESVESEHYPRVEVAPIVTGSKVIASKKSEIYQLLKDNYGNAVAVEMEGFGLLDAVRANSGVSAIVIRGISDLLEGKSAADAAGSQKLAAHHASVFAFELLAKCDGGSTTSEPPKSKQETETQLNAQTQPSIRLQQNNSDSSSGFLTDNKGGVVYNAEQINIHNHASDSQRQATQPETAEYSGELAQIYFYKQFPPEVAILHVEQRGNQYCARIYSAKIPTGVKETETSVPPPISLSQLMASQLSPKAIKGKLDLLCQKPKRDQMPTPLQQILDQIRKLLPQSIDGSEPQGVTCLLIIDQTDFEFPWEMLRLDAPDCYLGTAVVIARLQDIADMEFIHGFAQPKSSNHCCSGKVVVYADPEKTQVFERDVRVAERFQSICFQKSDLFFNHLQQTSAGVGLVFIASHASFQKNMDEISFGGMEGNQNVTLPELQVYLEYTDLFRNSPSVVFMNAHHSGRLYRDEQLLQRIGFATQFLAHGARGVIGTLEQVKEQFAMQVAQDFFAKCSHNKDLTVAEILCLLRKESLDRFRTEGVNDQTCAAFLYTFMYVYYGNPLTMLRLASADP